VKHHGYPAFRLCSPELLARGNSRKLLLFSSYSQLTEISVTLITSSVTANTCNCDSSQNLAYALHGKITPFLRKVLLPTTSNSTMNAKNC
jgi:hypothetical protein